MKVPDLTNLAAAKPQDAFSQTVEKQQKKASEVIRKTFTIEKKHQDYLVQVAMQLMTQTGRNISASEALRIVIERDMERNP